MSQAIALGLIPPRPGLEREEPELTQEDDIAQDDGTAMPTDELPAQGGEERPLRRRQRDGAVRASPCLLLRGSAGADIFRVGQALGELVGEEGGIKHGGSRGEPDDSRREATETDRRSIDMRSLQGRGA